MEFLDYAKLILAAKKVLSVRKKYLIDRSMVDRSIEKNSTIDPTIQRSNDLKCSLADLYDDVTMPKDLRDAHREVDKIVMKIYGFDESMSDEEIAINLLLMYEEYKNLAAAE